MDRTVVEELIRGLPPRSRAPWERVSSSYLSARENSPIGHITTRMIAEAWNKLHTLRRLDTTASMNAINKYHVWARAYHDPAVAQEPPKPSADRVVSAPVQAALDAVREPLERLSAVLLDAMAEESASATARAEATLAREREAAQEAARRLEAELADRQAGSLSAAEEFESTSADLEEAQERLQAVQMERDSAVAHGQRMAQAYELERVKVTAAQAQIESQRVQIGNQTTELKRLQDECEGLKEAAKRAADLEIEIATLRERAVGLADQISRQDAAMATLDQRHAREREDIRVSYEAALAEAHKRISDFEGRHGWLGVPVSRGQHGERG